MQQQVAILAQLGRWLDRKVRTRYGSTDLRTHLMRKLLKIRNKEGREVAFVPNEAQQIIAAKWGQKNIVLKARQLGISTYVSARYFIETITRPGTLSVQVAHDQRSAEDIFRN
ncbi:MAG: hypothetical protein ACXVZX_10385 [Terriglobales bacterium]